MQFRLIVCLGLILCAGCLSGDADQFHAIDVEKVSSIPDADFPETGLEVQPGAGSQKINDDATMKREPSPGTVQTVSGISENAPPDQRATKKSSAGPREIKLLIENQTFKTEGPEGAIRVSYDDIDLLKVLNMEPVPLDAVKHFPDWLRALDGKRVRIRGFMFPPARQTGITYFELARDNQICCFGKNAKVYDKFGVELRKGQTVSYIQNRPFDIVGIFRIDPFVDIDELLEIYLIEDAILID